MDGNRLTELLYAGIGKRLYRARDTSIVHYYIDSSKLLSNILKHRINPLLIRNVYAWKNTQSARRTRRSNYLL